LDTFVIFGELALSGANGSYQGILPIALSARARGKTGILVPEEYAAETTEVEGLKVVPVPKLRSTAGFLEGEIKIAPTGVNLAQLFAQNHSDGLNFDEVKGQESVKRTFEIPAADAY
jgi:magnesium chelatase family protein